MCINWRTRDDRSRNTNVETIVVIHVRGDENGDQGENERYKSKNADLEEIMKAESM